MNLTFLRMNNSYGRGQAEQGIANLVEKARDSAFSDRIADESRPLPVDFTPGPLSVIIARGKQAYNHTGNRRFRVILEMKLKSYAKAKSKLEKSLIVSNVIDTIREASPVGSFVKQERGQWYEVSDSIARERVGQGFRDLLHDQYKSSTKAKNQRRRESHNMGRRGSSVSDDARSDSVQSMDADESTVETAAKRFPEQPAKAKNALSVPRVHDSVESALAHYFAQDVTMEHLLQECSEPTFDLIDPESMGLLGDELPAGADLSDMFSDEEEELNLKQRARP